MAHMDIVGLPAFRDNYIWLLHDGENAAVVDPGDAAPVLAYLDTHALALRAILVTHHHADHVGGIAELVRRDRPPVFGPAAEDIKHVTVVLQEGDEITLPGLNERFSVLDLPGHTIGHIGYYRPKLLFCGDTLFAGGCGRLFEGSPSQMWRSLSKLAALPSDTRVYCAHEYTEANLRFALTVEPGNVLLQKRADQVAELRRRGQPSVPALLSDELATNPFLRCDQPEVIKSAQAHGTRPMMRSEDVFAHLRAWKDNFA